MSQLKCFLSFVVDVGTYSITFIAYISPQVILKSGFELEFDYFGSICPSGLILEGKFFISEGR